MPVTSFPRHTQRKKLKFSKTALSLAVKVKLSTFVCIFLVKLWRELRTRRAFDRCRLLGQRVVAGRDSRVMEKI